MFHLIHLLVNLKGIWILFVNVEIVSHLARLINFIEGDLIEVLLC